MKKLLLLLFLSLTGCDDVYVDNHQWVVDGDRLGEGCAREISLVEIDGCEYLYSNGNRRFSFTHKGNCRYCEMRRVKSNHPEKN